MAVVKKPYAISVDGKNYRLTLNDEIYTSVAGALGLTKATESTNFTGIGGLKDLRKAYAIVKVSVTAYNGDGANRKRKTFMLWCAASQLQNALGQLPNKSITYGNLSYNISSATARVTTRFR